MLKDVSSPCFLLANNSKISIALLPGEIDSDAEMEGMLTQSVRD